MIIDNSALYDTLTEKLELLHEILDNSIMKFFTKDFHRRFSWNSNNLEGNTLSLDETIDLIDYDETYGNHKYTEYTDAKNMYKASTTQLDFHKCVIINEKWVLDGNSLIRGNDYGYRTKNVFVGTHFDMVYIPPTWELIPDKVASLLSTDIKGDSKSVIKSIAEFHVRFERIHPFSDGNGRTGRLIMNQQLINNKLLPVVFSSRSNYQRSFKIYNKTKDLSLIEHEIVKAEIDSIDRILNFHVQVHTMSIL